MFRTTLCFIISMIMLLISFYSYSHIPDLVSINTIVHGFGDIKVSKTIAVVIIPAIYISLIFITLFFYKKSPENFRLNRTPNKVKEIIITVGALLTIYNYNMLVNYDNEYLTIKCLCYALAIFIIMTAYILSDVSPNFMFGYKLPWTLADADNWKKTHLFAKKINIPLGVAFIIINTFYTSIYVAYTFIFLFTLIPSIYSFVIFNNLIQEK